MFITTYFDEKYLGPAPVEPEKPEGLPADDSEPDSGKKPEDQVARHPIKKQSRSPKSRATTMARRLGAADGDADNDESAGSAKKDDQCAPPSAEDDPACFDADARPIKTTSRQPTDGRKKSRIR